MQMRYERHLAKICHLYGVKYKPEEEDEAEEEEA